jgi:hypothetical protein
MLPSFVYEAMAMIILRGGLEIALPRKHESTPGRIVSAAHSLACGWWISNNDWESAIAATFLYFVSDGVMHLKIQPLNYTMLLHHFLGAVLCFAAIHFQLWRGDTPEAALTNSLIMMETTSVSVQAAFIAYQEFEYAALMTPALIHFTVVRVICVGDAVLKNVDYFRVHKSYSILLLYAFSCVIWLQQIVWALLWAKRLLKELCLSMEEDEEEKSKVE